MKINISVHSAASTYGLVKGNQIFSEFCCCYVGSWWFYSKYVLFVVVCQHVVKSANGDLLITFKKIS